MDAETNKKCELPSDMWAVVKFYCSRGKTPTKMFEKMKSIYADYCRSRMQVFVLYKEYLERRETTQLRNSLYSA